jgi:hypothetical protein
VSVRFFVRRSPVLSQINGYGTLSVAIPGLQNGAPDGMVP